MKALATIQLSTRTDQFGRKLIRNEDEERLNENFEVLVETISKLEKRIEELEHGS